MYEFGLIAETRSVRGIDALLNRHDCALSRSFGTKANG